MSDPLLYSWPDPEGDGEWKIRGEPEDAWLERTLTRDDGEVVALAPDTRDCFDPLLAETLRLAAEVARLQSIVDQDIGGALDRAEKAVLNRDAGYESGVAASRERVAALEYFLRIYITAHQHGDSVPSLLEAEALETLGNAATLAALGEEAKDGE